MKHPIDRYSASYRILIFLTAFPFTFLTMMNYAMMVARGFPSATGGHTGFGEAQDVHKASVATYILENRWMGGGRIAGKVITPSQCAGLGAARR